MRLIRHTTVDVAADVCYGRLDVALASTVAEDVAHALADLPGAAVVYASPTGRCRPLAEALAQRDGVPLHYDERLVELDFGRWEGRRWSEIPRAEIDAWVADIGGHRPGGGESVHDLYARVGSFRYSIRHQHPDDVAIVTHLGPIRALVSQVSGRPLASLTDLTVKFGAWLLI